jgi:hypothetical protein
VPGGRYDGSVRVVLLLAVLIVGVAVVPAAGAGDTRRCGNVRVDRMLRPDPRGQFGAFAIRARDTGCRRARRLASTYVRDAASDAGAPRRIGRWRCTARTIDNQMQRVRCRLGERVVSFRNVLPSG